MTQDNQEELDLKKKRRSRKTLGEEGSRKQTALVLAFTLILSLLFYLPKQLSVWWNQFNSPNTITILKPVGDNKNVSEVVGFEVEIEKKQDVEKAILQLTSQLPGEYGLWTSTIDGQESLSLNGAEVFTAASVIKLPVLVAYYQAVDSNTLNSQEIYVLKEEDRWEYGTGSMQQQPEGTEYTYQQVAQLVANQSDNMGAEILIKKLGGYDRLQRKVNGWGLKSTDLSENETSPEEMGKILKDIYQGKLLTPDSRNELFENLTNTVLEDRLPAGVPSGVRVIHKFGSEEGVVNDCGVVESQKPYIVCILSTDISTGEAEELLPKLSRLIWEWLGN